jgi:NAD(P)-dependent dehydrogenase (short-subunit alcohol dehydrogenase family)
MPSVFITGANRGIGFELARQYSADGWTVYGGARNPADADADALKALGARVFELDVTNHDQIKATARDMDGEPIDLLINNAGMWIGEDEHFGRFTNAQWMEQFRVHVFGTLAVCEAFVDHVERSDKKLIVNISSGNGSFGWDRGPGDYPYDTSKAALNVLTKGMATDLEDRGITVMCMSPGNVQTDMSGPDAMLTPEESITGMRQVIDGLDLSKTGTFWHQSGEMAPW